MLWPIVLTDTRPDMKVMCREAFAPLVSVVTYRSFEDGLAMLADSPYGLQAGIYTNDLKKAFKAVAALDVGGVMVNDTSIFRVDHMPYGGNRMSGIGREGVRFAIEEMTNLRMVVSTQDLRRLTLPLQSADRVPAERSASRRSSCSRPR